MKTEEKLLFGFLVLLGLAVLWPRPKAETPPGTEPPPGTTQPPAETCPW